MCMASGDRYFISEFTQLCLPNEKVCFSGVVKHLFMHTTSFKGPNLNSSTFSRPQIMIKPLQSKSNCQVGNCKQGNSSSCYVERWGSQWEVSNLAINWEEALLSHWWLLCMAYVQIGGPKTHSHCSFHTLWFHCLIPLFCSTMSYSSMHTPCFLWGICIILVHSG